jgi:hypothetical protein
MQKEGFLPNGGTILGHEDIGGVDTMWSRSGEDVGKEKRVEVGITEAICPRIWSPLPRDFPSYFSSTVGGLWLVARILTANDLFCRRLYKVCDAIVIAVGYRLVLENRFPTTFDDGFKVVQWLVKHANFPECNKSLLHVPKGYLRND